MRKPEETKFDEVGAWSEIKLEILRKYAVAYSAILAKQPLEHFYIDGFAGAGVHRSRTTGMDVAGSPLVALETKPPFRRYFFVDLAGRKVDHLRAAVGDRSDVEILHGDSNEILLHQVLPQVTFDKYRRALCLLDPYGLHLDWRIIAKAGSLKTVDLFLNFPVADMNRNALWRDREGVSDTQRARMNDFWGDDTWLDAAYEQSAQGQLFGDEAEWIKASNERVAEAFRQRLRQVAGFAHVAKPIPMRNSKNSVVYFLYFASARPVAAQIVEDIFKKYR